MPQTVAILSYVLLSCFVCIVSTQNQVLGVQFVLQAHVLQTHAVACNLRGLQPTATNMLLPTDDLWNWQHATRAVALGLRLEYDGRRGCCACTLVCENGATCFAMGYGCSSYQNLHGSSAYQALKGTTLRRLVFTCSTVSISVPTMPSAMPSILGMTLESDHHGLTTTTRRIHIFGRNFGNNANVLDIFLGRGAASTNSQCTDIQMCHNYCKSCTEDSDCLSSSNICVSNVCLPKCDRTPHLRCPCGMKCGAYSNTIPVCVPTQKQTITTAMSSACSSWLSARNQLNAANELTCTLSYPEYDSVCSSAESSTSNFVVPIRIAVLGVISSSIDSTFDFDMKELQCRPNDSKCNDNNLCTKDVCIDGCCRYEVLPQCTVGAILENVPEHLNVAGKHYLMLKRSIDLSQIYFVDDKIERMAPGFVSSSLLSSASSVDDSPTALVSIEFPFLLFDQSARSKIYLSPNGVIQRAMTTPCGARFFSSVTSEASCNLFDDYVNMLLPLCSDFDPGANFASKIKYQKTIVDGVESVRIFFIEMFPFEDSSFAFTFGTTIQQDGTVRYHYLRTRFPLEHGLSLQGIRGPPGSGLDWFVPDTDIKDGSEIIFCPIPSVACMTPGCGIAGTSVLFRFTKEFGVCGGLLDTSKFKCIFGNVTSSAIIFDEKTLSCVVPELHRHFFTSKLSSHDTYTTRVRLVHDDYDSITIFSLTSELSHFTFTYSNFCKGADGQNRCGGVGSEAQCNACGACAVSQNAFKDCNGLCFGLENNFDCLGTCGNATVDCNGVCNGGAATEDCLLVAPSPSSLSTQTFTQPSPSGINSHDTTTSGDATKKVASGDSPTTSEGATDDDDDGKYNIDWYIIIGGVVTLIIITGCIAACIRNNEDDEEYVHRTVAGGLRSNPRGGLSKKALDNIPIFKFSIDDSLGNKNKEYGTGDCAVCLADFMSGDLLRKLPCGHRFCQECIDHWVDAHTTCPMCKAEIREGLIGVSDAGAMISETRIEMVEIEMTAYPDIIPEESFEEKEIEIQADLVL